MYSEGRRTKYEGRKGTNKKIVPRPSYFVLRPSEWPQKWRKKCTIVWLSAQVL
ncbi:hypothetical protein KKC59_00950 [bacterium]|nr:hypothetical protein [bacterium]